MVSDPPLREMGLKKVRRRTPDARGATVERPNPQPRRLGAQTRLRKIVSTRSDSPTTTPRLIVRSWRRIAARRSAARRKRSAVRGNAAPAPPCPSKSTRRRTGHGGCRLPFPGRRPGGAEPPSRDPRERDETAGANGPSPTSPRSARSPASSMQPRTTTRRAGSPSVARDPRSREAHVWSGGPNQSPLMRTTV